ncbi:unnamed protein product [Leuciscus chuanchicus]
MLSHFLRKQSLEECVESQLRVPSPHIEPHIRGQSTQILPFFPPSTSQLFPSSLCCLPRPKPLFKHSPPMPADPLNLPYSTRPLGCQLYLCKIGLGPIFHAAPTIPVMEGWHFLNISKPACSLSPTEASSSSWLTVNSHGFRAPASKETIEPSWHSHGRVVCAPAPATSLSPIEHEDHLIAPKETEASHSSRRGTGLTAERRRFSKQADSAISLRPSSDH